MTTRLTLHGFVRLFFPSLAGSLVARKGLLALGIKIGNYSTQGQRDGEDPLRRGRINVFVIVDENGHKTGAERQNDAKVIQFGRESVKGFKDQGNGGGRQTGEVPRRIFWIDKLVDENTTNCQNDQSWQVP